MLAIEGFVEGHLFFYAHLLHHAVCESEPCGAVFVALAVGDVQSGVTPRNILRLVRFAKYLLHQCVRFSAIKNVQRLLVYIGSPGKSFPGCHRSLGTGHTAGVLGVLAAHGPRAIGGSCAGSLDGIELLVP